MSNMGKGEVSKTINILYRYELEYTSEDGGTNARLRELPIIKETERTWLVRNYGFTKRVLKGAYSTFAYPTIKEAKEHFIRRTKNRIRWFEFYIRECKAGLELIEQEKQS